MHSCSFFFSSRRRHTRSLRDWSSDVCSSDLIDQHEVRERDYFFVVSFQVWGMFAAFGLVRLVRRLAEHGRVAITRWGVALASLITLLPVGANFTAASRRHGPDATIARDFAYNMLNRSSRTACCSD